jgi:hypothetical protein
MHNKPTDDPDDFRAQLLVAVAKAINSTIFLFGYNPNTTRVPAGCLLASRLKQTGIFENSISRIGLRERETSSHEYKLESSDCPSVEHGYDTYGRPHIRSPRWMIMQSNTEGDTASGSSVFHDHRMWRIYAPIPLLGPQVKTPQVNLRVLWRGLGRCYSLANFLVK